MLKNLGGSIVGKLGAILVSIVLCIVATFPSMLPERNIHPAEDGLTRIMTFNIRCSERKERERIVPQVIGEYYPDSIGIQECTFEWMLGLKMLLPEYEYVGVGRDTGNQNYGCGEASPILYRTDKYNLVDSGIFWLSETPDEVSRGWDGACNRVCTWVILERKADGIQYAHINTHLDHMGAEARTKGLDLVREFALKFDMPVVVTGDFNFREGTALYKQLTLPGLTDTKYIAKNTMSSFTFHGYSPETVNHNLPIDFVLVNNKITNVKSYQVITEKKGATFVSDHYPIYVDLEV